MVKICRNIECMKEHTRKRSDFCSRRCRYDYREALKRKFERDNPRYCDNCNKLLKINQKFFCCTSCSSKIRSKGRKDSEQTKLLKSKNCFFRKCKDKTLEEIYGIEKATTMKENMRKSAPKHHSLEHRKNLGKSLKGRIFTQEWKTKLSKAHKGRKHTEQSKTKMRISAIRYIKNVRGNINPNIGRNEKQLLDEQEQRDHCIIERQYPIKELGCFPDGYCHETNTIYWVHEKAHLRDKKMMRDFIQRRRIQEHLHCKFIIIYDGWTERQIAEYENKWEEYISQYKVDK